MNERATASEGTVSNYSETGSASSKKRAQRNKTLALDSRGANGETSSSVRSGSSKKHTELRKPPAMDSEGANGKTNSPGSLSCSEGKDSACSALQIGENNTGWCTVTHKRHSLRSDSTDSRRDDPRTFDEPRNSGAFDQRGDRRTGHEGWRDRGRGYRGRGDRGRGDRGRGNWGRGDRGRGNWDRSDRGRGSRGTSERGRSDRGRGRV